MRFQGLSNLKNLACSVQVLVLALSIFLSTPSSYAQTGSTPPRRDPTALTFLSQAVTSAGGAANLSAIGDFTAVGTINHSWNNKTQKGQLTVKSRGVGQFRIDSVLSQGTWSMIMNNGTAEIAFPSKNTVPIAYQNQINSGSLTFPILKVNTALADQTTILVDKGLVPFASGQAHDVSIKQGPGADPSGVFSAITETDYFFDPNTALLLRVQDSLYPNNGVNGGVLTRTLDLGSYQSVNGLTVPFLVTETVSGNQTWQIQLNSISFNTGLTDSDFQF